MGKGMASHMPPPVSIHFIFLHPRQPQYFLHMIKPRVLLFNKVVAYMKPKKSTQIRYAYLYKFYTGSYPNTLISCSSRKSLHVASSTELVKVHAVY